MQIKNLIIKKLVQVVLHLLFWFIVLIFYTYFFDAGKSNYNDTLYFSLFLMPITIATTYVSIYKLIPDYFITKRYFQFGIYSIYTLIISSYLVMLSIFFSFIFLSNFTYNEMNPVTRNLIFVLSGVYLVTFFVSAFKLMKLNIAESKKNQILETKILETQLKLKEQKLNYLKMQIHPHFLFNTLNTLYGFALKKAEETPDMILKLSNLLDYLLYQADKPRVSLKEELLHIEDYIALERLRFRDSLQIDFKKNISSQFLEIPPMLFIPFIENSFKHGNIVDGHLKITIELNANDEKIQFNIKNSISSNKINFKDGLGLQNIKKRLKLLFTEQYELRIYHTHKAFSVELKIDLKNKLNGA